ncbi:MAG: phosphopantetheine-binding protein, partial [Actinomycetota bacterium]|nr:phosphopantetheine-binding protein [Actinomycetota bacterium]
MSDVTVDTVRAFILEQVNDRLAAVGLSADQVGDDFDLVSTGTIDSMGLLELLAAVDDRFGVSASLEDMDVEDI